MHNTAYRKGSWIGIVRSGAVIVLEGQTDAAVVSSLWEFLGSESPSVHGVLNAVTSNFGQALLGMPQFGIVIESEKLNVILRGDMTLVVNTNHTEEVVSGRDVSTWSERTLALPDAFSLTLSDSLADPTAALLPLESGVVYLSDLFLDGGPSNSNVATSNSAGLQNGLAEEKSGEYQGEQDGPLDFDAVANSAAHQLTPDHEAPENEGFEASELDHSDESTILTPLVGSLPGPENAPTVDGDDLEVSGLDEDNEDNEDDEDEDDDDVFAGFAAASDAEWSAQLEEPNSHDFPLDMPTHQDSDLGQTIFPLSEDVVNAEESSETSENAAGSVDDELASFAGLPDDVGYEKSEQNVEETFNVGQDDNDELNAGALGQLTADGQEFDCGLETPGLDPQADSNGVDQTTNYDHLFGSTVIRSVEDAAVRFDDDGGVIPKEEDSAPSPQLPPPPSMPPLAGSRDVNDEGDGAQAADHVQETEVAPLQPPEGIMIDSVPWLSQPNPVSELSGDHPDVAYEDSDHDGQTVMVNRSELPAEVVAAASLDSRPPTGPMVLARLCPNGHANPPTRSLCSTCGTSITSEPREVGRPRLGRMHISTGEILDLDHSLIIGRQPSVSRVQGGVMPRLLQVQSASGDISRSHVEVRLDGWDVMLVDLKATNGTVLVREGQAPRRLGQGEQAILISGDIAELGDGISLLFEGLP